MTNQCSKSEAQVTKEWRLILYTDLCRPTDVVAWGRRGKAPSRQTLPAQSMTMRAVSSPWRGQAQHDFELRSANHRHGLGHRVSGCMPGRSSRPAAPTRLNSLKLARTLILNFFLNLKGFGMKTEVEIVRGRNTDKCAYVRVCSHFFQGGKKFTIYDMRFTRGRRLATLLG